jgi:pentatricopeptide repeat protein
MLRVFNNMLSHYVLSCNAILGGYTMHGHGKEALKIFDSLSEGVLPNDITSVFVLLACGHACLRMKEYTVMLQ